MSNIIERSNLLDSIYQIDKCQHTSLAAVNFIEYLCITTPNSWMNSYDLVRDAILSHGRNYSIYSGRSLYTILDLLGSVYYNRDSPKLYVGHTWRQCDEVKKTIINYYEIIHPDLCEWRAKIGGESFDTKEIAQDYQEEYTGNRKVVAVPPKHVENIQYTRYDRMDNFQSHYWKNKFVDHYVREINSPPRMHPTIK